MARDSWLHLKGLDSTLEIASEERNRTCLQDMNFGPFLADSIRPHAGLSLYLSLGSFETTANWMFQIVGPHFFCGAFSHVSAWRIRHCDVTRHNEPAQNGRNSWGWGNSDVTFYLWFAWSIAYGWQLEFSPVRCIPAHVGSPCIIGFNWYKHVQKISHCEATSPQNAVRSQCKLHWWLKHTVDGCEILHQLIAIENYETL